MCVKEAGASPPPRLAGRPLTDDRAPASTRRDRGCGGRASGPAGAGDAVAIPVEAVLRHALERRVVDVDDPEPPRVAACPFEVVEQAPNEVAANRRSVCDRAADCVEV